MPHPTNYEYRLLARQKDRLGQVRRCRVVTIIEMQKAISEKQKCHHSSNMENQVMSPCHSANQYLRKNTRDFAQVLLDLMPKPLTITRQKTKG